MTKNQWYVLAWIAISQLLVGVCVRRFSSIFVAILDFADVEYVGKALTFQICIGFTMTIIAF